MLPLLGRQASRALDADAEARIGVPGPVLMENAGAGATAALMRRFPDRLRRVVVVGGLGQNGGDAWVVARHLTCHGHRPLCVSVGDPASIRGDALLNFSALSPLGLEVLSTLHDGARVRQALRDASLIVDGIFGTGLDRPLSPAVEEWIRAINAAQAEVVALDLPSGVDADSGALFGCAVRATLTTTFVAHKRGLAQSPGREHAGEIQVCGIGVPAPSAEISGLLVPGDVVRLLPPRAATLHKGEAGRVAIIAGNTGTSGAALLSGRGALRAGAGLCTLMPRLAARQVLDARVLELMTAVPVEESVQGYCALSAGSAAAVLGPGFGLDAGGKELLRGLSVALPMPTVLDADALSAVAEEGLSLLADAPPRVLTPHPGEAARLLGVPVADVQSDRYAAASALAESTRQVVVLKGAGTVVAGPGGMLRVCLAGTPAMASAGMGDVLAGVVAAFLCHASPLDAAAAAVELHALSGERAARADRGLLASELADALPVVRATIASAGV